LYLFDKDGKMIGKDSLSSSPITVKQFLEGCRDKHATQYNIADDEHDKRQKECKKCVKHGEGEFCDCRIVLYKKTGKNDLEEYVLPSPKSPHKNYAIDDLNDPKDLKDFKGDKVPLDKNDLSWFIYAKCLNLTMSKKEEEKREKILVPIAK
jgi:hypothetical protein